jgi:thiaminase
MRARDLIDYHAALWRSATSHPFLAGARDGTLAGESFAAWLVQDYHYVGDLLVFQARLLARAPRADQAVLAGGLVGLEAELTWFEMGAAQRGLVLNAPLRPATAAYRAFLRALDDEAYLPSIVALWAIEQAYLDAWSGVVPGHPDYRPFVEHWTTPDFVAYVAGLERAADAALATGTTIEAAVAAFQAVARLERDFWEMAWTAR